MITVARSLLCVCTKDRSLDLERSLRSYLASGNLADILVVDSSGDDNFSNNEKLVANLKVTKLARITHVRTAPSLTGQRNIGKAYAQANGYEFLHFVDDDVEFEMPYIKPIEACFDEDFSVAGVTCSVVDPSGQVPRGRLRTLTGIESFDGRLSRWGSNYSLPDSEKGTFVEWLPGCAMSYRLSLILDATFDERRQGYSLGEDVDFSQEARKMGKLRFLGNVSIIHHCSPINREASFSLAQAEVRNRFLLASNHPEWVSPGLVHTYIWIHAIASLIAALLLRERSLLDRARGLIYGLYRERFAKGKQSRPLVYVLNGGLGNQLFILAAGMLAARQKDSMLGLDVSAFFGTRNIRKLRLSAVPLPRGVSLLPKKLVRGNYYGRNILALGARVLRSMLSSKLRPFNTWAKWPAVGYFQDLDFPDETLLEILGYLEQYPLRPEASRFLASEVRGSYCIHIRLGDYLAEQNLKFHGLPSSDYYISAMNLIRTQDPSSRFLIFTDSPDLVNEEILAQPNVRLSINGLNDFESLRMLLESRGLIMSNSSFSWWGGRLGRVRDPFFKIIAPSPWYSDRALSGPPIPDAVKLSRTNGEAL